jgi:hypothetical protein
MTLPVKTDPGAELRREKRFPCMFENIPISSISAETTVVLHRSLLTCQSFTSTIGDREQDISVTWSAGFTPVN